MKNVKINQMMSEFQLAQALKELAKEILGTDRIKNTSRNAIGKINDKLGKAIGVETNKNKNLTNLIKDAGKIANAHPKDSVIRIVYNITKVGSNDLVSRNTECGFLSFDNVIKMTVDGEDKTPSMSYNFDTTGEHVVELYFDDKVTNLDCIFFKIEHLKEVSFAKFDFCKIHTIYSMFAYCTNLQQVDFSNCVMHNIQKCTNCFFKCTNLKTIINSSAFCFKATTYQSMFNMCDNLEYLDLSNLNLSNATNLSYMFTKCYALETIGDTSNWNAPKCTTCKGMFSGCRKLKNLNLSNLLKNGIVTDLQNMFYGCFDLQTVGDLFNWNVSNVTTFEQMFANCKTLTYLGDLSNWNAPKCTTAKYMFGGDSAVDKMRFVKLDLKNLFKNGIVSNLAAIFYQCNDLEYLDVSNWNVQNVSSFLMMFCAGTYANGLYTATVGKLKHIGDLSNWNVSNATTIRGMFNWQTSLTSVGSLSNWDTSNITSMEALFNGTPVDGLDMKNWDTSKITNMYEAFGNFNSYEEVGPGITYIKSLCPIHKGTNTQYAFWYNKNLTTIEDSGTISASVNFAYSPLTHDSALVLINALDAENPGTLTLSATTFATLTEEDIKIATDKGWIIAQ